MVDDIFDTRFEGKEINLDENFLNVGDQFDLLGVDPALHRIMIGAGWDMSGFNSEDLDLDLSLVLLDRNEMTRVNEDFIFYNEQEVLDGGIKHHGDNRTGAGDGDDECISIDLKTVPFDIVKILVTITIYKGYERQQNLGSVRNGYVRLVNEDNNYELCRFKLDDFLQEKEETGVIAMAITREGPKWYAVPMNECVIGGLGDIARKYGMIINQE